jgi:hypothetical protein
MEFFWLVKEKEQRQTGNDQKKEESGGVQRDLIERHMMDGFVSFVLFIRVKVKKHKEDSE